MKPRKKLPRSLRLAVIAGQFRQQRVDMMGRARYELGVARAMAGGSMVLYYVREARAINWVMITQLRAARRAYTREQQPELSASIKHVLDNDGRVWIPPNKL